MTHNLCFFIIAVFSFFSLPFYLPVALILGLMLIKKTHYLLFFMIGLCYSVGYSFVMQSLWLPDAYINRAIEVTGRVESIPQRRSIANQFNLRVTAIDHQKLKKSLLLAMKDYQDKQPIELADLITAIVKLKPYQNYQNPYSQFYAEKKLAKGLAAKGYIVKWLSVQHGKLTFSEKLRASFRKKIDALYSDRAVNALMKSLLLGDRSGLTDKDWQRFKLTGTSHLIAISGLHVGLIAGFVFLAVTFLWRCSSKLCLWLPAPQFAAWLAMTAAWGYSLFTGFAVSTQRAAIMVSVFFLSIAFNKKTNSWHSYILAMALVLMINPWSIYLAGFYLSFAIVAVLLCFYQKGRWQFIFLQMKIWLMAMPISLWLFDYYSLASFVVNLVAIPLFSFILLPFGLLSLVTLAGMPIFSMLASYLQTITLYYFKFLDYVGFLSMLRVSLPIISLGQVIILSFAMALLLKFKKWQQVPMILFIMGLSFIAPATALREGLLKVDLFDVGQGLAMFLQTKSHRLIYDTGPRYASGGSVANGVILPYLKVKGISTIDKLIISHEDLDHRGGEQALKENLNIKQVIRSDIKKACYKLAPWTWDGIRFEFLNKKHSRALSKNNQSCVLKISNGVQSILIPGDIQAQMEHFYLKNSPQKLSASLLISPHHGSKTSSTLAFLKAVSPAAVWISAAANNRYHLPHPSVLKRYQQLSIKDYQTSQCGMLSWLMTRSKRLAPTECYVANQYYHQTLFQGLQRFFK